MGFRIAATLGPKDAGDITKALGSIAEGDTKTTAYLGVIYGKASGVSYRSNKFNPEQPAIALTGVFEAVPYDADGDTVQGGSLFLSGAVQDMLIKAMAVSTDSPTGKAIKLGQKIDVDAGKELIVKVEIGVKRNDGEGVGYTFVINHAGQPEKIDALEDLRGEIGKTGNDRMRAVIAGRPVQTLLAAPAAAKGGASKKAAKKK